MPDPFDGYQYLAHLRARWRLPLIVMGAALAVSLLVSLLLPKKYTARASLVIEPPAGSDLRASTAISPIYLESLKTYEHFASSDQLFAQAVERFQLRSGEVTRPLEGLKRSVLEVEIPRNTKILQVAVTLPDPQRAHTVALYIAEEAIKLNRRTNRANDEELVVDAQKRVDEAARRLKDAEAARGRFRGGTPSIDGLKAELEELRSMREEVDRLTLSADLTMAERSGMVEPADKEKLRSARSRAERLRRETDDLDKQIAARQRALAGRIVLAERLDTEFEAAWAAHDQLEKRLRELQATIGYRGERLNLVDPGVPPERPSFPNIPLNLMVAAALGLIASWFYLTVEYGLASQKAEALRKGLRVASKA